MRSFEAPSLPQNNALGIALIVAAMFVTSVQDVVFKLFSNSLPLGQIFALRALIAIPLLMGLAWVQGAYTGIWRHALSGWALIRSVFVTLLFLAFYGAIPFVSLSVLGAGTYTAPIFVALLSALFIFEPIRRRGWAAILVGFAGVLLLLQPGTNAFSAWTILPVVGAVFYAAAHVITRLKCQAIPLVALALSLKLVMLMAGLSIGAATFIWRPDATLVALNPYLLGGWQPVGTVDWTILGLLAVFTVVIGLGIAGAYKAGAPSTVATFEYSYLVFAALWDGLFFHSAPGGLSLMGMLLVVVAGLMAMRKVRDSGTETGSRV
ncbi:MAG: DMT family transporter [Pseudomonadota bacterium]